jgi:hypothetical protein
MTFKTITASAATVIPLAAEANTHDAFETELISVLKSGIAARKGMVFHVQGAEITGVVKEVREGAVLVSNHEHSRILIRFDRIDAVEGD